MEYFITFEREIYPACRYKDSPEKPCFKRISCLIAPRDSEHRKHLPNPPGPEVEFDINVCNRAKVGDSCPQQYLPKTYVRCLRNKTDQVCINPHCDKLFYFPTCRCSIGNLTPEEISFFKGKWVAEVDRKTMREFTLLSDEELGLSDLKTAHPHKPSDNLKHRRIQQ